MPSQASRLPAGLPPSCNAAVLPGGHGRGSKDSRWMSTVGWSPACGRPAAGRSATVLLDVCGKVQRPAAPQPSAPTGRQARRHDDVVGSPAPCPKPYSTGILKHDRQCPAAPIARHRRCPKRELPAGRKHREPSTTLFSSRPPSRAAINLPCRQMPGRTATAAVQRHRAAWEDERHGERPIKPASGQS